MIENYAGQENSKPFNPAYDSGRTVDRSEGAIRPDWRVYAFDKAVAIVPIPQKQDNEKIRELMARQGLTEANMGTLGRSLTTRHFADYDRPIEDES